MIKTKLIELRDVDFTPQYAHVDRAHVINCGQAGEGKSANGMLSVALGRADVTGDIATQEETRLVPNVFGDTSLLMMATIIKSERQADSHDDAPKYVVTLLVQETYAKAMPCAFDLTTEMYVNVMRDMQETSPILPVHDKWLRRSSAYVHKKRGTVYTIAGFSVLQMEGKHDMALVVHYVDAASKSQWTRLASEFYDGRFERLDGPEIGDKGDECQ